MREDYLSDSGCGFKDASGPIIARGLAEDVLTAATTKPEIVVNGTDKLAPTVEQKARLFAASCQPDQAMLSRSRALALKSPPGTISQATAILAKVRTQEPKSRVTGAATCRRRPR